MDIRNVVIIMDTMRFTKEDVVQDLQEEGYKHNFFFANFNEPRDVQRHIYDADEIWVWGDCTGNAFYKMAKDFGKDIWKMKK